MIISFSCYKNWQGVWTSHFAPEDASSSKDTFTCKRDLQIEAYQGPDRTCSTIPAGSRFRFVAFGNAWVAARLEILKGRVEPA